MTVEPEVACPETQFLMAWLDGTHELSGAQADHLKHCPRCASRLLELTDDEVLSHFATPQHQTQDFDDEPEFQKLRSNLEQVPDLALQETHLSSGEAVDTDHQEPSHSQPATVAADLQDLLPGSRYQVDRLLASGGSGQVYLAFDTSLSCPVAIKVLSRQSMRDRQRFSREAKVLAEIGHPNVVRIFDVGSLESNLAASDSEQYLVTEYLAGGTIGDRVSKPPSSLEEHRQIATWIAQAADGLSAAHTRNLIHRDIKPSNILLTEDRSEAKVIDFGLALTPDHDVSKVTRDGAIIGTPAYMSPEQISGDEVLSPATDVYSLGATLYALLTGQAPFHGNPASVIRQVTESTAPAPRILNPNIPADLETICLYAMQRDPSKRYASVMDLAEDLRRFKANQLIHARPVSSLEKGLLFLRQNPALGSSFAAITCLVAILLIGATGAMIVLNNKNEALANAVDGEKAAKSNAILAMKESIAAADELLVTVTTETEYLPRAPGSQEVRRALLEKARSYFEKFLALHQDTTELKEQLARAHAGLGTIAARTGDVAKLKEETQLALRFIESIPDTQIKPAERSEFKARALTTYANYLIESGSATEAIPLFQDAITSCQAVATAQPNDLAINFRESFALSHLGLANAWTYVGETAKATDELTQARELLTQLVEEVQGASQIRSLATTYMIEATMKIDRNQSEAGIELLDQAQTWLEKIDSKDGISLRVREMSIKNLINLALAQKRLGNHQTAKDLYAEAIGESKQLIELEPLVPAHQWNLVVAVLNSGGPDLALGNLEELVQRWRDAEPVLENLQVLEPDNGRYRQVHAMLKSNIAVVLRDMGKLDEAVTPLVEATSILLQHAEQQEFAPEPYFAVAQNHFEIASTYLQLDDVQNAEKSLADSNAIAREIASKHPDYVAALSQLVENCFVQHRLYQNAQKLDGDALANARIALELGQEATESAPEDAEFALNLARAWTHLAEVHLAMETYQEAWESAQQGKSIALEINNGETSETGTLLKDSTALVLNSFYQWQRVEDTAVPEFDYTAQWQQAVDMGIDVKRLPPRELTD